MNPPHAHRSPALWIALACAVYLFAPYAFAGSVITTTSLDAGGLHTTSANYAMDGSMGGIGGISSAASDAAKHGYIGQLTEVVTMSVTGTPCSVNEGATGQLSGSATLDDATVTKLSGSDITWGAYAWPIHDISASGVVTTDCVYADTPATMNCSYLGVSASGRLLVLDCLPDDYGSYAGDGLPDNWQVRYFGLDSPNAAPTADADGTGQNNLFKYVAGLNPTDPSSVFVLQVVNVPGQPNQKNLIYNPIASGRTYTLQFRTNLTSGTWATLTGISSPLTNANQVIATDLNASQRQKFYRVNISLP